MSTLNQIFQVLRKYQLLALIMVIIIQIAVPLNMILSAESTILEGGLFKFKCAPVDPFDPFRGKFVSLKFEAETHENFDKNLEVNKSYYALIKNNQNGFAEIKDLSETEPTQGDYFKVRIIRKIHGKIFLEFPFNRYYIEESKAKAAEDLYRRQNHIAVANVYISKGNTVLKKIMLADKTLEEAAIEFMKTENK